LSMKPRPGMTWAVTGHRPHLVPDYSFDRLADLAAACLQRYSPARVLLGAALGFDTAVMEACLRVGVAYEAYVPFVGQEKRWGKADRDAYHRLLAGAARVVVVSDGTYSPYLFKARNKALVDHSEALLALFSGAPSGTSHCVSYAKSLGRPVVNVWGSWVKYHSVKS
jgi:predicted Rossmann fold nucleotide-binding protein DprA/Smf involved in DNA uptake